MGSGTATAVKKREYRGVLQVYRQGIKVTAIRGAAYYVLTVSSPFPNVRILPATVQRGGGGSPLYR